MTFFEYLSLLVKFVIQASNHLHTLWQIEKLSTSTRMGWTITSGPYLQYTPYSIRRILASVMGPSETMVLTWTIHTPTAR